MSAPSGADAVATVSPQAAQLKAQLAAINAVPFFEKCLTNSDAAGHGRVVLPKAIAETQFADMLEKQGAIIMGEDIDGNVYNFKFRFWTNNQSRMYLIEGCSEVLKRYHLGHGDVIVFAKKADGVLLIAGRPAGPEDVFKKPPVRSRAAKSDDKTARAAKAKRKIGPQTDGIFRATPGTDAVAKVHYSDGVWACLLNVAGEAYQALFDLEADAWEAYHASIMPAQ